MKTIFITTSMVLLISACSNSSKPQSNSSDSSQSNAADAHEHHHEQAGMDTTVIQPGQKEFFKNLQEGMTIKLPYVVEFGVEGMEVEPAQGVNPNKGHHHLIIDQGPVAAGQMVPMGQEGQGYYHYGKGQLRDTLTIKKFPMLKPGKHKMTLQFANGLHLSYGQGMSQTVTIEVKP